jgi:predicted amidohydrolase
MIVSRANEAEQLVFTDLDPAIVTTTRRQFPVEKDRRDALYHSLSRDSGGR